ncbi:hypothetical protein BN871_HS_00010 [Paenibacillus sp. P22]|nr:hypothetical protein BN871_HS_00010 [Paenibacillus sp. P22]
MAHPPLKQDKQAGQREGHDEVDAACDQKRLERAERDALDRPGVVQQLGEADDRNERGILDDDDKLVAYGRQHVAESLRQHDEPHRHAAGHPEGAGRFGLAFVDGLDARPEYFRHISGAVDRQGDDARDECRQVDADRRQRVVDDQNLHEHRGAADDLDVRYRQEFEHPDPGKADKGKQYAEESAEQHSQNGKTERKPGSVHKVRPVSVECGKIEIHFIRTIRSLFSDQFIGFDDEAVDLSAFLQTVDRFVDGIDELLVAFLDGDGGARFICRLLDLHIRKGDCILGFDVLVGNRLLQDQSVHAARIQLQDQFRDLGDRSQLGAFDFFGDPFLDRTFLDADFFAFQIVQRVEASFVSFFGEHALIGHIVDFREVDGFGALLGRRHARDDEIDFARIERQQQAVKVHVLDFQLRVEILGDFLGDLDVEADDRVFAVNRFVEFVRRIIRARAEHQRFLLRARIRILGCARVRGTARIAFDVALLAA